MSSSKHVVMQLSFALSVSLALSDCQSSSKESGVAGMSASNGISAAGNPSASGGSGAPVKSLPEGTGGGSSAANGGGTSAQTGAAGLAGSARHAEAGAAAPAGSSAGGASGTAPSAGAGGGEAGAAEAGAGGASSAHDDLGKGDGSDVITIGDSWMNILTNGGGIEGGLDRAGTSYRHYAVAGTTLIGGDIPQQYLRAKAANPKILTVIMTGGGNDIMFSNGCATKESCQMAVQQIADALDQLWTMMADDGVKDTIFIEYSKNAGTAPSDTRPDTAPIPKICTSGRITCHAIDTTPLIGPGDTVDGIHPTPDGCDRIAKATLDVMQQSGARR